MRAASHIPASGAAIAAQRGSGASTRAAVPRPPTAKARIDPCAPNGVLAAAALSPREKVGRGPGGLRRSGIAMRKARLRGARGEANGDAQPLPDVEIGEARRAAVDRNRFFQTGDAQIAEGGERRRGREQCLVGAQGEQRSPLHRERRRDEHERHRAARDHGPAKGPERPGGPQRGPDDRGGESAMGAEPGEGDEGAKLRGACEEREAEGKARLGPKQARPDRLAGQRLETRLPRTRCELLGKPGHAPEATVSVRPAVRPARETSRGACDRSGARDRCAGCAARRGAIARGAAAAWW